MTHSVRNLSVLAAAAALAAAVAVPAGGAQTPTQREVLERSQQMVPTGPWKEGDERGMANTLGQGTWQRCAYHLSHPRTKSYELSHVRSNTMPLSPFGVPLKYQFRPSAGIPGTRHGFNGEQVESGEPGAQGTQMDAIGHFAYLDEPWTGEGPLPADKLRYYGGFTQQQVKPTPDSPLLKLGIEKAPPIVTSAVLLDARSYISGGRPMAAGEQITVEHIEGMIRGQGLGWRGLLPGDVLYIYTGWSDYWRDPDRSKRYYTKGPGLSYGAVKYLESKKVVLVALDNPFTDPAADGQIMGKAPPPKGTPKGLPWAVHHYNLTQSGIHQIQNANLAKMARDRVWTSCTMILPLRTKGAAGSPVRPVAFGFSHN